MSRTRQYAGAAVAVGLALVAFVVTRGPSEDDIGRVEIAGEVRLDGAPLDSGRIRFTPDDGTRGPIAWGTIEGGRFAIPRAEGPAPGTYRVAVLVGPPPRKELRRGEASSPPLEIEQPGTIEVPRSGPRYTLALELKSPLPNPP